MFNPNATDMNYRQLRVIMRARREAPVRARPGAVERFLNDWWFS